VFTIATDVITRTVNPELVDIDQEFNYEIFSNFYLTVNKTISIRITRNDEFSENISLKTEKQFNNVGCGANYSV